MAGKSSNHARRRSFLKYLGLLQSEKNTVFPPRDLAIAMK
jgi:hypothetical protein